MLLRLIAIAALLAIAAPARAELPPVIKIGILNDQSGPFADQSGKGSVVAAQLAADDFAKEAPGIKVEIIYGDHQNKPTSAPASPGAGWTGTASSPSPTPSTPPSASRSTTSCATATAPSSPATSAPPT